MIIIRRFQWQFYIATGTASALENRALSEVISYAR